MQLTLAMMMQSRRSNSERVAERRSLSKLVVDGRFFLDVDVSGRNVRFRLVEIVVADEVLDRIFWKECFELVVELRSERFIVRQHQRGPMTGLDDLGHREGLPGSRNAQQNLVRLSVHHTSGELFDGGGLIASGLIINA